MTRSKKAKEALKEKGEGNIPDTTPVTEEKPAEEVPKPEVKAKGKETETEEKVPGVPEKEPKKGRSQRIRQLVKERDTEKAKSKSLADKLAEVTGSVEPQVGYQPPTIRPQEEPIVRPGEELDAAELEQRLQAREQRTLQKADALAILRTKQQDAINRINSEASEAMRTYPELDPESDSFDKELSESVTEAVEAHVRADPFKASVKKFVGKLMKPYKRAVAKEVGKVTEKVAKQASETALRPTPVKAGKKKFEELTEKQMEKKLGVVY